MRSAVADAARFLVEHARERVTLGDVADAVSYSPFHLARTFAEEIRVPPGQYLAAHRFQLAKQLLLSGNDAVVEICHEVGFASLGTFTTRFTAVTGTTPAQFRHLPDLLVASPPRPMCVEGPAPHHGVVTGTVHLSTAASQLLGPGASVYIGLFPRRAAFSVPIAGSLLAEPGPFRLAGVPAGRYWLLSTAVPSSGSPVAQLLPLQPVAGASPQVIEFGSVPAVHRRAVVLDVTGPWSLPVLVALPALASKAAQDRRNSRHHGTRTLPQ